MITNQSYDANYKCVSLNEAGEYNSLRLIQNNYNIIVNSKNPSKHENYNSFMKSIAYFVQVASDNVSLLRYNTTTAMKIKKEAKQVVKFLKAENFDFEPVKKIILQDAYSSQQSIVYWNEQAKTQKTRSGKNNCKDNSNYHQENYYSCLTAADNLSSISKYNDLFTMAEEIASLKESIAKLNTKSSNILTSIRMKAQQKLLGNKTEKLLKTAQNLGLSQSQLEDLIKSRCESAVLEEAIKLGEEDKTITQAQEQAIVEKIQTKYSSLIELNFENIIENEL